MAPPISPLLSGSAEFSRWGCGSCSGLLLAEMHRRYAELGDVPADALRSPWSVAEWETALEYGVEFKPHFWFPGCTDSQRIRLLRELAKLIDEGLVTASRADGSRWSNVKLTDEGERMIEAHCLCRADRRHIVFDDDDGADEPTMVRRG